MKTTAVKVQKKTKGYTLAERVKEFTSSLDIDYLTPEDASNLAAEIHFFIFHNTIKKNK